MSRSETEPLYPVESENALLKPFETPHNSIPFSKFTESDFPEAFDVAIKWARDEVDAIVDNEDAPSFANTVEALEFSGARLDRISGVFFNLNSAETTEVIQKLAQDISPKLSELSNDIKLNPKLFARIKEVWESRESLGLTEEQSMLLDKKYKSFSRNGANLSPEDQETLRGLDTELSKLSLTFSEHVLADTNAYEMHLENEADLDGLPESQKTAARERAQAKEMEGWLFTLDYPSYGPFMKYAKNRDLRQKMSLAFGSVGFQSNDNNNEQVVLDIAKKRCQRARLLGYASHAEYVLEERMAESPRTVDVFLEDLLAKAKPAAERDFAMLEELARKDGIETIEKWDGSYYSELLTKQQFNLDQELLRPYFSLDSVLNGAFQTAGKLYGLTYEKTSEVDVYHEDVQTFIVKENGEFKAILYADFFPRKGKKEGAWMTAYKDQWTNSRPHVSIVCNFPPPTSDKPSLLSFDEVTTLFHEFGHSLHGTMANTNYPSLSGTNVAWDFVELPSQMNEQFCYESEALALFANHYETGEVLPPDFIQKIKDSANFLEGWMTLRQLSFGLLDMHWHGKDPSAYESVLVEEQAAMESTRLYPVVPSNLMSTSFGHIFSGGYSAGYYSYKWAEVLDADAFSHFQANGIFNPEISGKFKTLLASGGSIKAMKLYEDFRGQKPTVDALLIRAGLKE